MQSTKKTFRDWWYEAISEKGVGSSKRLAGLFITFVSMCCIVYLTITEGATVIVQDLLQTSLITGTALLGLYSITSVLKSHNNKISGGSRNETHNETHNNIEV